MVEKKDNWNVKDVQMDIIHEEENENSEDSTRDSNNASNKEALLDIDKELSD